MRLSQKRCELERFRRNFLLPGYLHSLLSSFHKNRFPTTFGGHLKFLRKTQKVSISEMEQDRATPTKFLTHRVSTESTGDFSQKLFSRHFWWPS